MQTDMSETFQIQHDGKTFRIPRDASGDFVIAHMHRKGTFYEADLLGHLHRVLAGEGCVVDCGANIGNHTLFFAGVMGRHTFAIEPMQRNRTILTTVLRSNDLEDHVTVCPVAVGDKQGEVSIGLPSASNPGNFRISEDGAGSETVPVTTLDELLLQEAERVALLKLDLEGYEIPALKGGLGLIARDRPLIVAELVTMSDLESFHGHLQPFGYQATQVFCATPTILFAPSDGPAVIADAVMSKLRKYERKHGAGVA